MKQLFVLFISLLFHYSSFSQKVVSDSVAYKRNQLNTKNTLVLGSWAASNIIYSTIAIPNNTSNEKYFHKMNVYWNVVNLSLAGVGYFGAKKHLSQSISLEKNLKEQKNIENLLLINSGLDVGYMLAGWYLQNRSKQQNLLENQYQMKGYGQSLILQGGFLLLFDVVQYFQHHHNGKQLNTFSSKASLSFSGQSLTFNYQF